MDQRAEERAGGSPLCSALPSSSPSLCRKLDLLVSTVLTRCTFLQGCFQGTLVALIPSSVLSALDLNVLLVPGQRLLASSWDTPFTLPAPLQLSCPKTSPREPSCMLPDTREAQMHDAHRLILLCLTLLTECTQSS